MLYNLFFTLNFTLVFFAMRAASWRLSPKSVPLLFLFFKTPYLSQRTLRRPAPPQRAPLLPFLGNLGGLFLLLGLAKTFLVPLSYWDVVLISPLVYFLTEALGQLGRLLFQRPGRPILSMHVAPFSAESLSQFWGRRWNIWVQDWFKDVGRLYRGWPGPLRVLVTFLLSGCFHELMFSLPLALYFGENNFGPMMLYFLIQALGVGLDRYLLARGPRLLRRSFLWAVVLLPAPLFITAPLLRFLGLHHG